MTVADHDAGADPATRAALVRTALSFNGACNGQGYDGQNPFSSDISRPAEAWCGDYVTDMFKRALLPLPPMQPGCRTGFAYCPAAVSYAQAHNAVGNSWQAEPGDIALFDWDGDGSADHTELVTGWRDGALYTIGGNSGPSNLDAYRGDGGVHRHYWPAPAGTGNSEILLVVDAAALVTFGVPRHTGPGKHPAGRRLLMLKTPFMSGADVTAVQRALDQKNAAGLAADGVYGSLTRDAVMAWQTTDGIAVDGIVGPQTRASLGLAAGH